MEDILVPLVLLLGGLFLVYLGVSGFLGYRRRSYILWYEYGYISAGINYSSTPLGIAMVLAVFVGLIPMPQSLITIIMWVSIFIGLLGISFGMFQPDFLKPKWYLWLETNHGDIMSYLERDVQQRSYKEWRKQTDNQEALEAWVAEVREKNNL